MADGTVTQLQKYLVDIDYKKILTYCVEPKQWNDIAKLNIKQSKVFQILKDLKTIKALEFSDGKYLTASYAKEHIE